jgi:lactoylglutathione lyase
VKAAEVLIELDPTMNEADPWGNRIEIVGYDNVQFIKASNVLRGMGLAHLTKPTLRR